MATEADQIEAQARTIKALWVDNTRLRKRVDDQQSIIDMQNRQLDDLHQQATPRAQAERIFG